MRRTAREETDFTDDTGVFEGPTLSILIKNMTTTHRHERHDRHVSKESAPLSRFLDDGRRDDGVTVTRVPGRDRHGKPHIYGKCDDGDVLDDEIRRFSKGGA